MGAPEMLRFVPELFGGAPELSHFVLELFRVIPIYDSGAPLDPGSQKSNLADEEITTT